VTNLAPRAERVVASTTSAAQRCGGSRRARARSNGHGCHAAPSPPTRCPPAPRAGLRPGQLHAHAGDAEEAEPWSLTSLREKLIKIGAKVVSHGRYVTFQMAEVAVSRQMFADILSLITRLWTLPAAA
jgi:hypothetical protein